MRLAQAIGGDPVHRTWEISLVRGHALIHASGVLEGGAYIWPQWERSAIGRELRAASAWLREVREKGVECDL